MTRCGVNGCPNEGSIVVPVGPDVPRIAVDEDGEPYFDVSLDDPPVTYVTGRACAEHVGVVKMALRERHQPHRQAMREGRPWPVR